MKKKCHAPIYKHKVRKKTHMCFSNSFTVKENFVLVMELLSFFKCFPNAKALSV